VTACYAALRVLTGPASEPVTVSDAKAHCRIDTDYDDTLLATYVSGARIEAEQYLNRALFTQQLQYNITTTPPPTATPLVPQSLLVFPLNWPPLARAPLELPRAPLVSVEGVQWGAIGDMQPADPTDYDVNLLVEPGYVAVKPQLLPRIPQTAMSINFTAGWSDADPLAIPATVRLAILIGTAHYYENRGDVAGEGMPPAFYRLLDPYRLWTFAG
jgi:uncharacterized phiE125 gp8 family phage protein